MIVVVATLVGMLVAGSLAGKLRRLATIRLRWIGLVWSAIILQTILFEVLGSRIPEAASQALHLFTYALCAAFLWMNLSLPGALVVGVGAGCNFAAIAANAGVMPASPHAWERAGLRTVAESTFENSNTVGTPRLSFLGDVFYVPQGWPLANVFSVGDVIIVLGATWLAFRWCGRPSVSNEWPAPSTARYADIADGLMSDRDVRSASNAFCSDVSEANSRRSCERHHRTRGASVRRRPPPARCPTHR